MAEHLRLSRAPDGEQPHEFARPRRDAAVGADDLQRLESSVEWLKREVMIARLEAGTRAAKENRKLPRAALLPPVSGVSPVDIEGSRRRRETATFLLAPPPIGERVQPQLSRGRRNHSLRGAQFLLIASLIAGSIVYHFSAESLLSAWESAQAASLQGR
jgi:hypothetical protein